MKYIGGTIRGLGGVSLELNGTGVSLRFTPGFMLSPAAAG